MCQPTAGWAVLFGPPPVSLPVDVLAVINSDDVDDQLGVFDAVDDAVAARAVLSIALPLTLEKLAKLWMGRQPLNGFGELFAEFAVGTDEAVELLLGNFREDDRIPNRHKPC